MVINSNLPIKKPLPVTTTVIVVAVGMNGLLFMMNDALSLPLFFDSFFTIMISAFFGLVPGIITGLLSNLFYEVLMGFPGNFYPFALVNMFTAIATAVMVRKGFLNTPIGVIWIIFVLTLGNSILGAVIVTFLFEGFTNLVADDIVKAIIHTGNSIFTSALFTRILINFTDKGIAVLLTYFLYRHFSKMDRTSSTP
ncbi:hypothetical protein EXM22_01080 [Oceanispirochaeta crateris]|uniref:ECF transporter S component n=1 Tax=Oceanispirochaeta crateris TaxID=2518645 RepID=A0A5C1QHR6_9SPIO|nr:hypothetical protein [Oceanispirochaeta crateris]QEN06649.1 hypothetical protein EXM22_01080 [Oceanispirochaeta crateris]